jgi:hypothetical protein
MAKIYSVKQKMQWKMGKRSTRQLKVGMAVWVTTQYDGTVIAEIVEEVSPGTIFTVQDAKGQRHRVLQSEIL